MINESIFTPKVDAPPTPSPRKAPSHMVTYPITPINWVSAGKLGAVKNQGFCASCWIFSAVGTLESYLAIKNNAAVAELSIQQLVDCCH